MERSALYYPYIDINNPVWLRSALLFWDRIHTIVPRTLKKPYQNADTEACFKEGYLVPVYCDEHKDVISKLGTRAIELLKGSTIPLPRSKAAIKAEPNIREILKASHSETRSIIHSTKLGDMSKKLVEELSEVFETAEQEGNQDWILTNRKFGDIYMAALALLLAEETGLSPVTNSAVDHGSAMIAMLADSPSVSTSINGALMSITLKSLKINPDTPIDKILDFKRRQQGPLTAFRSKMDSLEEKLAKSDDAREATEKAKELYNSEIEKGLNDLAYELQGASIQNIWDGVYRATVFSIPVHSVLANAAQRFTLSEPVMLGAGAFLAATDVAIKTYFAHSKARRASAFTYLLDADRSFGLPSDMEVLMWMQEYEQGFAQ